MNGSPMKRRLEIEPGRIVLSKAGRDAGRPFLVLRTDDAYAWIADGTLRKAETPKKKKHRHLRALPLQSADIAQDLTDGKTPSNATLRKVLAEYAADRERP